jgi:hypothetical protein
MKSVAVAFPILPGKEEAGRRFAEEVQGPRSAEMDRSLRERGAVREEWYLQPGPFGSMILLYIEAEDPRKLFQEWALSQNPFDCWFKQQAQEVSGVDFNQPLTALPEQIYAWKA